MTIKGKEYDLTEFARRHPGGERILREYHGKDATEAFLKQHHSPQAVKMMQTYRVYGSDESSADTTDPPTVESGTGHFWLRRLFTREDPYGVHKSLGLFVLVHFAFYFGWLATVQGREFRDLDMWQDDPRGIAAVAAHGVLSASSFIFNVPRERVEGAPMIWQEFRAHNAAFAMRSVCVYAIWWMNRHGGGILGKAQARLAAVSVVIGTIVVADAITERLRSLDDQTTTRTMPYWSGVSPSTVKAIKQFYMWSQIGATLTVMVSESPAVIFVPLFGIQLSSFLMTLVRKGLIESWHWHLFYGFSLAMGFLPFSRWPKDWVKGLLGTSILHFARLYVFESKYVMWIGVGTFYCMRAFSNNIWVWMVVSAMIMLAVRYIEERQVPRVVSMQSLGSAVRLVTTNPHSLDPLPGQHILLGERPYTPVSVSSDRLEFFIKIYDHPQAFTHRVVSRLSPGDRVRLSTTPLGKIWYAGQGRFATADGYRGPYRKVALVSGGTGVTPMLRIAEGLRRDGVPHRLFAFFSRPEDVVVPEKHPHTIVYTSHGGDFRHRRVSPDLFKEYDVTVVCGPDGFIEAANRNDQDQIVL